MSLLTKAKRMTGETVRARSKSTGEIITGTIKMLNGKGVCFVWKDDEKGAVYIRLNGRHKSEYSFINKGVAWREK